MCRGYVEGMDGVDLHVVLAFLCVTFEEHSQETNTHILPCS